MKKKNLNLASPTAVRKSMIGSSNYSIDTPFGSKPLVYADTTASGKSLEFIEDYIRDVVLVSYANTHTEASATGRQTTHYREQARRCIHRALKAPEEDYAVLFCGSGSTAAITKLANVLGISPLAAKSATASERPVVFCGFFEHHSNELLWRESNVDCVVIPEDPETGGYDMQALEAHLTSAQYASRPLKIGSFSAASNVTGICADTQAVTDLLHQHGAYAFWDFAACGPHLQIDAAGHQFDAVYLSTHKYAGGPGTPGLLVARRSLFSLHAKSNVPTQPGGGTVHIVLADRHNYAEEIEHREEGGTPAIVESIRAGLVLQLHSQLGDTVELMEQSFLERALSIWKQNPYLVLLGSPAAEKHAVPIVSFLVKSPAGNLHHNFVVAILNDLFGIQSRGGCACAGPYSHILLDVTKEHDDLFFVSKDQRAKDLESVRPGWTRISFGYYMSDVTVDYLIAAVDLVAREGYKLLPFYNLDPITGVWTHVEKLKTRPVHDLTSTNAVLELWDFSSVTYKKPAPTDKKTSSFCLQETMQKAKHLLDSVGRDINPDTAPDVQLSPEADLVRWYLLPKDAATAYQTREELRGSFNDVIGEARHSVSNIAGEKGAFPLDSFQMRNKASLPNKPAMPFYKAFSTRNLLENNDHDDTTSIYFKVGFDATSFDEKDEKDDSSEENAGKDCDEETETTMAEEDGEEANDSTNDGSGDIYFDGSQMCGETETTMPEDDEKEASDSTNDGRFDIYFDGSQIFASSPLPEVCSSRVGRMLRSKRMSQSKLLVKAHVGESFRSGVKLEC